MFKSLFKLAEDVAEIAAAPMRVIVDTARLVTKPLSEAAKEVAETV